MTRRKRFQFVGLFPRNDDSVVGVVLYRGHRFGLTYIDGSDVTPAIVTEDFNRLGTSMFHYGFSPVDAQGVYHNAAWTESFKRKEDDDDDSSTDFAGLDARPSNRRGFGSQTFNETAITTKENEMKLIWRQNSYKETVIFAHRPGAEIYGDPKLLKPAPKDLRTLCSRLLEIGGMRVVCYLDGPFAFLRPLVTRKGELLTPEKIRMKRGEPSDCFDNSMALLVAKPEIYSFGIGWGLTKEIWRPHAWVMDEKGALIETTEKREKYFGAVVGLSELQKRASK